MELLQHATDDQIALAGCTVALILSITLMFVSTLVRRSGSTSQVRPVPVNRVRPLKAPRTPTSADSESTREAA